MPIFIQGLALGHVPHVLTMVLQPRPTALCPVTDSPLSIFNLSVRETGQGVVPTGGTANQGLGEGLSVLQHSIRWQGGNRGSEAVTWK